jgi:hypothetical protein
LALSANNFNPNFIAQSFSAANARNPSSILTKHNNPGKKKVGTKVLMVTNKKKKEKEEKQEGKQANLELAVQVQQAQARRWEDLMECEEAKLLDSPRSARPPLPPNPNLHAHSGVADAQPATAGLPVAAPIAPDPPSGSLLVRYYSAAATPVSPFASSSSRTQPHHHLSPSAHSHSYPQYKIYLPICFILICFAATPIWLPYQILCLFLAFLLGNFLLPTLFSSLLSTPLTLLCFRCFSNFLVVPTLVSFQ